MMMTGKKNLGWLAAGPALVLSMAAPAALWSQQQTAPTKVHGKVNNAIGQTMTTGDVKFTTDKATPAATRKYEYDFPVGQDGTYTGTITKPGEYLAVYFADGKSVDYQEVSIKPGEDRTINFDMTREEYMKQLTPEERQQIEDIKKKNAGANSYNAKVSDLNKGMVQARADAKAGKTAEAVTEAKALTESAPTEPLIWATLGEMQLADGNAATAKARAAHTATNDPAIVQRYADSAASFQKSLDLSPAEKKPKPEFLQGVYRNMGEADIKAGKAADAKAAYDNAAKANPAGVADTYFNEAANFFNAKDNDDALPAAEKAIAADPKRPLPYYIKGQALIQKATVDPKTNKILAPPGCVEAYQEYLELDPNGQFAAEVKSLLTDLGQPIKSTYKRGK